jgi:hypothetical protein
MRYFEYVTTEEKKKAYLETRDVFDGLIKEIRELSKKKSDATLSKGKIGILNRVLVDIKAFLDDEPEGKYLDLLNDEDLPQNSDAVLVMVQYEGALESFLNRYHHNYIPDLGNNVWATSDNDAYMIDQRGHRFED